MSRLASFIYFDDNVKLSNENSFNNIFDFFIQTEHMTTLSVNGMREEVTLDIKFTINISKNCLIYGKRGSGKSYLCESLCMALLGCDDINNNVIDNDDKTRLFDWIVVRVCHDDGNGTGECCTAGAGTGVE